MPHLNEYWTLIMSFNRSDIASGTWELKDNLPQSRDLLVQLYPDRFIDAGVSLAEHDVR